MPNCFDGVILVDTISPTGDAMRSPPAIGVPLCTLWQAMQSEAVAR